MKISLPSQTLRIAKTNLNRFGQSHLIALAVAITLALFTPADKSSAQIATNTYPQSMLYTMPSMYAAPTTVEDVITNCDMLEDPSGAIKAAAWSSMNVKDALGRTIQECNANIPVNIDVSRLPSGFYTFRAIHQDGKTSVYKFTKE